MTLPIENNFRSPALNRYYKAVLKKNSHTPELKPIDLQENENMSDFMNWVLNRFTVRTCFNDQKSKSKSFVKNSQKKQEQTQSLTQQADYMGIESLIIDGFYPETVGCDYLGISDHDEAEEVKISLINLRAQLKSELIETETKFQTSTLVNIESRKIDFKLINEGFYYNDLITVLRKDIRKIDRVLKIKTSHNNTACIVSEYNSLYRDAHIACSNILPYDYFKKGNL